MSCRRLTDTGLADTGLAAPVVVVLVLAAVLLLVGLACVLRARAVRGGPVALLLAVLVGSGLALGIVPAPSASAAPPACPDGWVEIRPTAGSEVTRSASFSDDEEADDPDPQSPLSFVQTSVLDGIAPGVEPATIAGLVVNNGPDDVYVGAIVVDIVAVDRADGSVDGTCDATDYVLQDPRMTVGQALAPDGGSATYSGAAIGFNNKSTNQDACQGATVRLRYLTSD